MSQGPPRPSKPALDQLLENAPAAVYVKDRAGNYLYVNRGFEVLTKVPSDQVLGRTDFDLFPAAVATVCREHDGETLERMCALRFDEPGLVPGAQRLWTWIRFPVLEHDNVLGVCGISVEDAGEAADQRGASRRQRMIDANFGRLLASLTPQEVRVLDLVATGLPDRQIAERLNISNDTVRHHVSHVLRKLRKRRSQVIIEMLRRDRR